MTERTRNLSPDGSQLNQFKLFCQIYSLICAPISMGRTGEHTQWVICAVDYFHRFSLHIKWLTEGCICPGNRTELSPIPSVVILMITAKSEEPEAGVLIVNR